MSNKTKTITLRRNDQGMKQYVKQASSLSTVRLQNITIGGKNGFFKGEHSLTVDIFLIRMNQWYC